jgi:RimJ/RimL family protein N-acetyltransferase
LALIEIAHPDFRQRLLTEAKQQSFVPAAHKVVSCGHYLVEEEHVVALKSGRKAMLRPARGSDAPSMRTMFHLMSSEDVYTRFFHCVSALSYNEAQRLCNVDFENDVAFVAVTGPRENEEIVGTAGSFLNRSTNLAEMAYMIVPDWQGTGLGSALQQRLKEFAQERGVRGFVAELLRTNKAMINLAKRLGPIDLYTDEDGISHVTVLFA